MIGERLLGIAGHWFNQDIVARVFEPLVADWQHEHHALGGFARGRSALGLYCCFAATAALMLPWQLKQRLPERVTLAGWMAAESFALIGIAAQWYFFFDANPRGASHLLPAAGCLAVPLALIPAAIVTSRFGTPVETRTMMLRLTLLVTLALAPVLAWWMPNANQSWRIAQTEPSAPPRRGDRELTVNDLLRSEPPSDLPARDQATWAAVRQRAASERVSVLLMPLPMTAFGLALAHRFRRRAAFVAFGAWAVAGLIWLTLLDVSPWMTHLILLGGVLTVVAGRQPNASRT